MLGNNIILFYGLILTIVASPIEGSSYIPPQLASVASALSNYGPSQLYDSLPSLSGISSYFSKPLENSKISAQGTYPPAGVSNTLSYSASAQPGSFYVYGGGDTSNHHPTQGMMNGQFISSNTGGSKYYPGQPAVDGQVSPPYYGSNWRGGQNALQTIPPGNYYQNLYGLEPERTFTGAGKLMVNANSIPSETIPNSQNFYSSQPNTHGQLSANIPNNQNLQGSQPNAHGQPSGFILNNQNLQGSVPNAHGQPINGIQSDYTYTKLTTPPMVVDTINFDGTKPQSFYHTGQANMKNSEIPFTGSLQTNINMPNGQTMDSRLPNSAVIQSDRPLQNEGSNQNVVGASPTMGYTPYKKPSKLTVEELFSTSPLGSQLSTNGFIYSKDLLRFNMLTGIINTLVDLPVQLIKSILSTINKHFPNINVHERLMLGLAAANAVHDGLKGYILKLQKMDSQNRARRSIQYNMKDDSLEYVNLESLPMLPAEFENYIKDKISPHIPSSVNEGTEEKFFADLLNDLRYGLSPQFKFLQQNYPLK